MLHDLLDNTTKRRIKILETMLFYDRWIPSSDLAEICDTSSRTINNDLQFLRGNYSDFFKIETSKQHGVRIQETNYFRLEQFYRHLINEDSIFQLVEGIFFHPHYSNQTWIESLYLSTSSFYRLYNRIQAALKDYNICLQMGYRSENEIALRYFFSNFFTEKYSYETWPFDLNRNSIVDHIKDIVSYIQNKYCKNDLYYILDSHQILHIAMLIAVCAVRIKQGFHCQNPNCDQSPCQDIIQHFYDQGKNLFKPYMDTLSVDEYSEICYSIFAFATAWKSKDEFQKINRDIAQFIEELAKKAAVPITKVESTRIRYMMLNKYSTYQIFPYEEELLFNKEDFIGCLIFEAYPKLFETLLHDLDALSEKTAYPWLKDMTEIIFHMIVKWPALTQLLIKSYDKVKAIVISDLGIEHQKYLCHSIENVFSNFLEIDAYPYEVFQLEARMPELKERYDLIILSFDYMGSSKDDSFLYVNPILSDFDFRNITNHIQNYFSDHSVHAPKVYAHSLMHNNLT